MSLILEALKKVERERQTHEAGAVVIGATAWAAAPRRRWPIALALAVTALLGAGAAAFVLRAPRAATPPSSVALATTPAAPPATLPPPPMLAAEAPTQAMLPAVGGTVAVAPLRPPKPAAPLAAGSAPAQAPPATQPATTPADEPEPAGEEPASAPVETAPPSVVTAPPAPSTAAPAFRLQAITDQNGQPVAMLNDRLVREGDTVDGAVVVRIGVGEVELEVNGQRRVLRF